MQVNGRGVMGDDYPDVLTEATYNTLVDDQSRMVATQAARATSHGEHDNNEEAVLEYTDERVTFRVDNVLYRLTPADFGAVVGYGDTEISKYGYDERIPTDATPQETLEALATAQFKADVAEAAMDLLNVSPA